MCDSCTVDDCSGAAMPRNAGQVLDFVKANVEPQLRFDKETLKRSVRVAVPRFGVDSLTRHANERDKKKRNPEFENKRASKKFQ